MISERITTSQLGAGVEIVEQDFDLAYVENQKEFEKARAALLDAFGFGRLDAKEIRLTIASMGSAVESLLFGYLEGKLHYVDNEIALLLRYVYYEK